MIFCLLINIILSMKNTPYVPPHVRDKRYEIDNRVQSLICFSLNSVTRLLVTRVGWSR